jgi:hypothetical protein
MRSALASLEVGLRLSVAALALGLPLNTVRADSLTLQNTLDKIRSDTSAALSAQRAADTRRSSEEWARRNAGPDFDSYGSGDNRYTPSSSATGRMSREAPPPPGARWVAMAQQAWQENRDEDAAGFLQRASEAGNPGATRILGVLHEAGLGVVQDAAAAIGLYRRAVAMGDDEALLQLGRVYALGIGVAPDYAQSVDWYTKASRRASTREQADRALPYVRQLQDLELQVAAADRCEKAGNCGGASTSAPVAPAAVAKPAAWTRVTTMDSVEYYIGWAHVSPRNGRVQTFELMNYSTPQRTPENAAYLSAKLSKEYDCQGNTVRWMSAEGYEAGMGRGGVTMTANTPLPLMTPQAGSAAEAVQNSVCGR